MTAKFIDEPNNLLAVLQVAEPDDLAVLVDYLTDKGEGRVSLKDEVCHYLVRCKNQKKYDDAALFAISQEICAFGGNTLINLFRGGGVSYLEVVQDVADHLGVSFNKSTDVPSIEDGIMRKLLTDAFEKMGEEERRAVLTELNVSSLSALGPTATAVALGGAKLAGFATYKIALIVANAVAKAILGKGLSLATNAALTRAVGVMLGPVGWVITGLWTIADFASPAYRVTVPCVVQVAYIRQKALAASSSTACPECQEANPSNAKFCSECGTALNKRKAKALGQ
jgi:uncharacterized protein YaaW (UPF0174 family)